MQLRCASPEQPWTLPLTSGQSRSSGVLHPPQSRPVTPSPPENTRLPCAPPVPPASPHRLPTAALEGAAPLRDERPQGSRGRSSPAPSPRLRPLCQVQRARRVAGLRASAGQPPARLTCIPVSHGPLGSGLKHLLETKAGEERETAAAIWVMRGSPGGTSDGRLLRPDLGLPGGDLSPRSCVCPVGSAAPLPMRLLGPRSGRSQLDSLGLSPGGLTGVHSFGVGQVLETTG